MGTLIYNQSLQLFIWNGEFKEYHLPKSAGFFWNAEDKRWETSDVNIAAKLTRFATHPCNVEIKRQSDRVAASYRLSFLTTTKADIACPEGQAYLPFQKVGILFATAHKNALIADPTGVGKTVTALGTANFIGAMRILIICPSAVKESWRRHCETWLTPKGDIYKVTAQSGWPLPKFEHDRQVVIINYDIINRHVDRLSEHWDLIICDESHYLKNKHAGRSMSFYLNAKDADKVLFLSATPLKNHPAELWPQLLYLDSQTWNYSNSTWDEEKKEWTNSKEYAFHKKYCGAFPTKFGWVMKGEPDIAALNELEGVLRQTIMIRRDKKKLLKDLPPKFRKIVELPVDKKIMTRLAQEQEFWEESVDTYGEIKEAIANAKLLKEDDYQAKVQELNQQFLDLATNINKQRRLTALYKIPYALNFIEMLVEGGEDKVVLFAYHRKALETLHKAHEKNSVLYYGGMSENRKQQALDRFAGDDDIYEFFGSILAAGLGLNELVVASQGVFLELTYVPADITQAEDRLHRKGQKSSVVISQLVFPGTIDSRIANIILKKQKWIDAVLDSKHATAEEKQDALISSKQSVLTSILDEALNEKKKIKAGKA